MDNPFGKHIFTQLEGMPPHIVTLTPCVNPITGVPLFYGEVTNIPVEPEADPVQYVQGIVVRTLVWQEGKMEDYFSGSDEAVLKWNTTLKWAMETQEIRFVLFNFKKPLQKSTFSESSLALTTGTVAPEITCTAILELTERLFFSNIGGEKTRGRETNDSYKTSHRKRVTVFTRIPPFLYKPDSHQFRLKMSDEGHIIAEKWLVQSSGRGKLDGDASDRATLRSSTAAIEKEEEKAPEKEEENRATLRFGSAVGCKFVEEEEEEEEESEEE